MSREPVISIAGVSKGFAMRSRRATTLKAAVAGMMRHVVAEPYQALQNVSFDVFEGETVGIIGSNGSGKSTVLKLIIGIIKPTLGKVTVRGRISPLIELGAGFHPEFTGRENVFLNGAILGVPRKVLEAVFDEIVEFSGVGAFIDQPIKTFSSGMFTRLAFAIAVHMDPDILVVDEVLAVGDEAFQQKCLERVRQFREAGKTILFVAHQQQMVASICDRVIWLEKGVKRMDGPAAEVLAAYEAQNATTVAPAVTVESLALVGVDGMQRHAVTGAEPVRARFTWRAHRNASVAWSISIRSINGAVALAGADARVCHMVSGETGETAFTTALGRLASGEYELSVRVQQDGEGASLSGPTVRFRIDTDWAGPAAWHLDGDWALHGRGVLSDH